MAPKHQDRELDIVLLGATGYTGTLTAEHIAAHLPTNLKWALAGRSPGKLEALADKLKRLHPDRVQPSIEIVSLDDRDQLGSVLRKARVCISVVLYAHVGAQVVEACVENGTDYVDTAGSVPTMGEWFAKYHEKAQAAGVALIHACGAFTAPHDLLAWLAAGALRKAGGLDTRDVVLCVRAQELDPSGGTVDSIVHGITSPPEAKRASRDPWHLSPVRGAGPVPRAAVGMVHRDPRLGVLADSSYGAAQDRALVHRTWGLLSQLDGDGGASTTAAASSPLSYGPNFQYSEYDAAPSWLAGLRRVLAGRLQMWALSVLVSVSPRAATTLLGLPAPGAGPDPEAGRADGVVTHLVALAVPEKTTTTTTTTTTAAFAEFRYPAGAYHVTAVALAQGAASLLYRRELLGGVAGGCLTPAFLGHDLVERLRGVGAEIDVRVEGAGAGGA